MALVRIRNRLPQKINYSVQEEGGPVQPKELPPKGVSEPVMRTTLTEYTLGLVRRGHLKLRPAQ